MSRGLFSLVFEHHVHPGLLNIRAVKRLLFCGSPQLLGVSAGEWGQVNGLMCMAVIQDGQMMVLGNL